MCARDETETGCASTRTKQAGQWLSRMASLQCLSMVAHTSRSAPPFANVGPLLRSMPARLTTLRLSIAMRVDLDSLGCLPTGLHELTKQNKRAQLRSGVRRLTEVFDEARLE